MLKIKYIAVHMFNDFSGSPRVLADFCALNCIPSEDLTIITSNTPGFLGKSLGRLRLTRYRRTNSTLLNRLMFFLAQCQTFFIVISLCIKNRRAGERVVIINNTIFCLASMIAGWIMGAYTIVYIHELYSRSSIIKKMLERLVNLMSDKTFIVSQLLMKSYRLDPQKTFLLPNGLRADFDMQNELDPQAKFSHGTVLFVGMSFVDFYIMPRRYNDEQYLAGALGMYLTYINLFVFILRLMIALQGGGRRD